MRMNVRCISIVLLSYTVVTTRSFCSNSYGAEPCNYLPAPPGKTPNCARPGYTYCEYPDHYPGQVITYLVKQWKYDHTTLFSSESKEDYSAYFYPPINPVYGPPNYQPPNVHNHQKGFNQPVPPHIGTHQNGYPEPIYIPKPQYPYQEEGYNYNPPQNYYPQQNFTGYPDAQYKNYPPPRSWQQPYQQILEQPQYGQYNNLWKRSIRRNHQRFKRSLRYIRAPRTVSAKFSNGTVTNRVRRQSPRDTRTICSVRTQYIIPKAALNNKGNWRYVANMPEIDTKVTQLVKTEICASQTCDGICSIPDGYTSRCEQKFVQKRLVALEAEGNRLYTDVFWFPSCCLCTLTRVDL
ncbi:unnamed protein product [Phyllotreta striolata]|uniref:Spaetzle domain-containing protein n=1 Tax=Phyllotreta striolata TaxID=444603 RepID=A0A9P0DJX0_PHYSR|nr:unnamed protein product [Phyllotreta striolata]